MKNKAFTLIELIVGITISMLLMVTVGIFVSSGMGNIFAQQKSLENMDNLTSFITKFEEDLDLSQSGGIIEKTSSGIIFKRLQSFGKGGFSYIGTEEKSDLYCLSDSENNKTNHLILKSFIPFEENGEDIFSNYENILKSKLITISGKIYQSIQKEHKIINFGTKNTIIGKGIFGSRFKNGVSGKDIYLNSPTGLATDGIILFISDTLNNRVLWYDITNDEIHILLDVNDGLNEPTGLYYNTSEKALYIANSGKGEILKYSSENKVSFPKLKIDGINESNVNKIEIIFPSNSLSNTGNWTITNSFSDSYLTGDSNILKYYSISKNSESVQLSCAGTEIKFDTTDTTKPKIYCTKSGSGQTVSYPKKTISEIEIDSLNDFTNTGSYYVNLKLYNGTTEEYNEYHPYFTQGDDDLTTLSDNTLEIIKSGLNYPTGIWGTGNNDFNEFGKTGRDFNKIIDSNEYDIILKTPIKSFEIDKSTDLLSFILKYYKKYNCYNLDEKIKRTYLFKKSLK